MSDVAQLGLQIDSTQVNAATAALDKLTADQCAPAVATMLRLLKEEIARIQIQRGVPPESTIMQ